MLFILIIIIPCFSSYVHYIDMCVLQSTYRLQTFSLKIASEVSFAIQY